MIFQNTLINVKEKIKRVDEMSWDREVIEDTYYFISKERKDSVRYHGKNWGFILLKAKATKC